MAPPPKYVPGTHSLIPQIENHCCSLNQFKPFIALDVIRRYA